MTLTLPDAWLEAARSRSAPFRGFVEIAISPSSRITINDYAALFGTGADVAFLGVSVSEGTDWTAAGSNSDTAQSIIDALKATPDGDSFRFHTSQTATGETIIEGFAGTNPVFGVFGAGPSITELGETPNFVRLGFADELFHDASDPDDTTPYPPIVHEIRGLDMEIEPVERGLALSDVEIEIADDGLIRQLMRRQILLGKSLTIWLGFEGLDIATEYVRWPRLQISGLKPSVGKTTVTISAKSRATRLIDRTIENMQFVNSHPKDAAIEIMQAVGMGTDDYDAASWAPYVEADQGHYLVSRFEDEIFGCDAAIKEPISALDAFNSLLQILGGTARLDSDGALAYQAYDYNASAVRSFSNADDVSNRFPCEIVDHQDLFDLLYNRVTVNFANSSAAGKGQMNWSLEHEQSIDETGSARDLTIDSDWINAIGIVQYYEGINGADFDFDSPPALVYPDGPANKVATNGAATTLTIAWAPRMGFCGTAYRNAAIVDPEANITGSGGSPARWSYILVYGAEGPIVLAGNQVAPYLYNSGGSFQIDQGLDGGHTVFGSAAFAELPISLEWTIDQAYDDNSFTNGWNGFGTSADFLTLSKEKPYENQIFYGNVAVDLTIVSAVAQRALERFKFGAARITIRTTIDHFDLEVGDVVSLGSDDVFMSPLVDGANDAVTFEIVTKRCRFFEDTPSMEFDLVMLKAEAQDVIDTTYVFPLPIPPLTASFPDELVMNDGDPVWTDLDGDGSIEPGDDYMTKA